MTVLRPERDDAAMLAVISLGNDSGAYRSATPGARMRLTGSFSANV